VPREPDVRDEWRTFLCIYEIQYDVSGRSPRRCLLKFGFFGLNLLLRLFQCLLITLNACFYVFTWTTLDLPDIHCISPVYYTHTLHICMTLFVWPHDQILKNSTQINFTKCIYCNLTYVLVGICLTFFVVQIPIGLFCFLIP
jgi:hypothetical protein